MAIKINKKCKKCYNYNDICLGAENPCEYYINNDKDTNERLDKLENEIKILKPIVKYLINKELENIKIDNIELDLDDWGDNF